MNQQQSAYCIWLLTRDWALAYVQSFNTALLLAVKHAKFKTVRALVLQAANVEAKNTKVEVVMYIIYDKSQAANLCGCHSDRVVASEY